MLRLSCKPGFEPTVRERRWPASDLWSAPSLQKLVEHVDASDLLANHGKRGMSAKRMSRLTGCQFTHLALRPNNRPVCFGAVRFPTSKRVPAKWACIGPSTDEEQVDTLVRCLLQTWRMPQPRVIISIVGCESDAELERSMKAQHRLVFIRGLLRAARTTHAWILTSGKSGGVDGIVDAV